MVVPLQRQHPDRRRAVRAVEVGLKFHKLHKPRCMLPADVVAIRTATLRMAFSGAAEILQRLMQQGSIEVADG